MKKPSTKLNIPIIGKIKTRKIESLYLEGQKSSIDSEEEFDVIGITTHNGDKVYVIDEFEGESDDLKFVHNNFVKKYYPKEEPCKQS